MKIKERFIYAYNKMVKVHKNVSTLINGVNKVQETVTATQTQIGNIKTMASLAQTYTQTGDKAHIKSMFKSYGK